VPVLLKTYSSLLLQLITIVTNSSEFAPACRTTRRRIARSSGRCRSPRRIGETIVLFGNDVALRSFFHGHAGLYSFSAWRRYRQNLALELYDFLAAELAVARDKNRALVEFRELRRGGAPGVGYPLMLVIY